MTKTKTVGQLRYAAVDALLPLAIATVLLLLFGVPGWVVAVCCGPAAGVALWRLVVYVGQ